MRSMKKFKFKLASDYESALHRFDADYEIIIIIIIIAKLGSIIREIIAVKKECILRLTIVKVDTYQDEVKQ
jgi:hypothetical protein